MQLIDFDLRGQVITLDRLLKATGVAPSGGAAKQMVADGKVQVDGRDEVRKRAQIHAGQVVAVQGTRIRVVASAEGAPTAPMGDDVEPPAADNLA